jgi:hypothetical protein
VLVCGDHADGERQQCRGRVVSGKAVCHRLQ